VIEASNATALQCGDAVLDVKHIARWAGCVGNRSTIVPVVDAKHDVFLSMPQPRQVAYQQLDSWLDDYLGAASNVASQNG
jgi:alpha-beta hydrolase superfamily lysophospholipase